MTVRSADGEGGHQPDESERQRPTEPAVEPAASAPAAVASAEGAGGTLVLEHAYRIERRLETGPFHATWSARQTPFDRLVHLRFYEGLDALGLADDALTRLREHIDAGGDGDLAVDVGELESGAPFLVLEPPRGTSLEAWWQAQGGGSERLRRVVLRLLQVLDGVTPAQRRELALERLHVEPGSAEDPPPLRLYSLGDQPSRGEVRQMTGLATAGLVRGFPPECFLTGAPADEALEATEAADMWRVGAVVHGLLTGRHPLFIEGEDVAEVTARLVSGQLGPPSMPAMGDEALDELLGATLALDPEERPSRAALATGVTEVGRALAAPTAPAAGDGGAADVGAETPAAQPHGLPRAFRVVVTMVALVVVALATYLLSHQPPTAAAVVITSDPPGVRFQRVNDDGVAHELGRTPILIESEPIDSSLAIQPVYEDGAIGEVRTLTPERLELFDACRRLHVEFEP